MFYGVFVTEIMWYHVAAAHAGAQFSHTYNYIIIAALCLCYYIIYTHSEHIHMHGTVQAQMSTCTITKDTMSTSRPIKSLRMD